MVKIIGGERISNDAVDIKYLLKSDQTHNLSGYEIDFIPDFRIEQGNILCSIETNQTDVEFAYYLQLNDNPIQKTWYSESKENHFKLTNEEISKFKID